MAQPIVACFTTSGGYANKLSFRGVLFCELSGRIRRFVTPDARSVSSPPPKPASPLYREEALAHQRERAWGELIVLTPGFARAMLWLLCLLAIVFVVFLSQAEYTRKARAFAVLSYAIDPTTIAATDAGMLANVLVKEGDRVKRGQVLATISTERTVNGEATFATSATDANARKSAIAREKRELESQLNAQSAQLVQRVKAIEDERAALKREIAAQEDRVTQLQSQVDRFRELAKSKFVSDLQVQTKQDERAEQVVKLETLKRSDATLARDLAQARSELPLLQSTTRSKLATIDRDAAQLVQTSREDASRRAYDIAAAADAVVERVIANAGQTLVAGAPILKLQSGSVELQTDLFVPTRSAGFLQTGQIVRLAIDAFPFERYGHIEATIVEIGRVVLLPGEAGAPAQLREPAFRVRAKLNVQEVAAYGQRYPLRSGLTAQADIALDRRPLYRWVIEPVLRLRGSL
jgi:membrane fusion protein